MSPGSFSVPALASGPWSHSAPPANPLACRTRRRAFTLVKLLAVIRILLIMLVLIAPAFTQLNAARVITKASYDISGLLEEARVYAKANDTYTWVGFYEEDASQSTITPATGRVIVSVVAS